MKALYHRLSTRHLVILGLAIPVVLLLLVGFLQWQSARDFRASRERSAHTRTVLINLEALLSCVQDAETGQRGYLLTHRESYLEPYREAMARTPGQLAILRGLVSDDREQETNLERLGPLITAKYDELAQTVTLEEQGDHAAAIKIVMTDAGKNTMDDIRATLGHMHDLERGQLVQREAAYQRHAAVNSWLSDLFIALGLGFLVVIVSLLKRLENLESMVTICAWSKMIEYEGQWLSIEEYLGRRLRTRVTHGISEVEAEKMLKFLEKERPQKAA